MQRNWIHWLVMLAVVALLSPLTGCGTDAHDHDADDDHTHGHDHDHDHDHGHHGHHHVAPHGGALHEIGDHFAHLEFLLDSDTGVLTMYVLDGEAENAIRLEHETIAITVVPDEGEPLTLQLDAVASVLTGETVGNSSQFQVQSDELIGASKLRGTLDVLAIRGHTVENVEIIYPEGNEGHHHH